MIVRPSRILIFLALAVCLFAQIVPVTIADITGDGAAHAIASTGTARTITIAALSTNTGVARIGDSNVSTSRGAPLVAGASLQYPESSGTGRYSLNSVYYLVASGDKISISYTQ